MVVCNTNTSCKRTCCMSTTSSNSGSALSSIFLPSSLTRGYSGALHYDCYYYHHHRRYCRRRRLHLFFFLSFFLSFPSSDCIDDQSYKRGGEGKKERKNRKKAFLVAAASRLPSHFASPLSPIFFPSRANVSDTCLYSNSSIKPSLDDTAFAAIFL